MAAAPVARREVRSPLPEVRRPPRRRSWSPGVVTAVLIVAALTLMLLDVRGGATDVLRSAAAVVGGPLQSASSGLLRSLPEQVSLPDAAALQQEITRLQEDNDRLALANTMLAEQFAAVAGDRTLAAFADTLAETTIIARVVGSTSPPAQAAVTIDAGSTSGITPDSAVLTPAGLVGRVVDVGPATSTVQLITSPDSGVAVRVEPPGHTGLARGNGDPYRLALWHVDALAGVRAGQSVVTMGSPGDRPFPAGLRVGTLSDVGPAGDVNRRLGVTPAVNVGTLNRVVVLVPETDPSTSGPAREPNEWGSSGPGQEEEE